MVVDRRSQPRLSPWTLAAVVLCAGVVAGVGVLVHVQVEDQLSGAAGVAAWFAARALVLGGPLLAAWFLVRAAQARQVR